MGLKMACCCVVGCSCRDGQAPLNGAVHVSGSQMSLHARLHSKRAIIYANSAALVENTKDQANRSNLSAAPCEKHIVTKNTFTFTFRL